MLTLGVKISHNFTNARKAAEIKSAIFLIDQAAGADLYHLQKIYIVNLESASCSVGPWSERTTAHCQAGSTHNDELVTTAVKGCFDAAGNSPHGRD